MIRHKDYSSLLMATGLTIITLIGAYLRLYDLDVKGINHPEMYVPGIHLPIGLSEPRERLTLASVLTGTFSADTHPPGYYILMWMWTKLMGAELWSIRLPSALLGIASIPLLFWLGAITGNKPAGLLAAALLALNGYHIFWSKIARMFSLACFLGLLATVLLLLLARATTPRPRLKLLYAGTVLVGLASHIFFWLLFVTHIMWVAACAWSSRRSMPGVLKLQVMALVLASPLLIFAVYQSGSTLATMSADVSSYTKEFIQFSFLLPTKESTAGFSPFSTTLSRYVESPLARNGFFGLSVLLLLAGLFSLRGMDHQLLADPIGPSPRHYIVAAGLGVAASVFFVVLTFAALEQPSQTIGFAMILIPLPLALALIGAILHKQWSSLNRVYRPRLFEKVSNCRGVVALLAVVPLAMLAFISQFKPILNQRGMMFATPYILLVLAAGIVSLIRYRLIVVVVAVLLAVLSYQSIVAYGFRRMDPVDFKSFAQKLAPQLADSDLVFLQRSWYATPILFYLHAERYHLVGRDYSQAIRQSQSSRVWALLFYKETEKIPVEVGRALEPYHVASVIEVPYARAVLYVR